MIWHYTVGLRLASILKDGFIKPATAYLSQGERGVVWFSTNPLWEETANKTWQQGGRGVFLNKEETSDLGNGLYRIAVAEEVAPMDWRAFKDASGIHHKMATGLYQSALDKGARPGQWRATFEKVPRENWLAIERFDSESRAWVSMSAEDEAGLSVRKRVRQPYRIDKPAGTVLEMTGKAPLMTGKDAVPDMTCGKCGMVITTRVGREQLQSIAVKCLCGVYNLFDNETVH